MLSLSLVLPAYNEADNIEPVVSGAVGTLRALVAEGALGDFEVIVVDDGSTDGTAATLEGLQARWPVLRVRRHDENRGYGAALRTGFSLARGELVAFSDADGQFDLGELAQLLEMSARADIVAGVRAARRDPLHRRLNARAWGGLVRLLFDLRVADINCAFKLMHRRVLDAVELRSTGAFVNTELLVRARAAGFTVVERRVGHYPRPSGRATGARPAVILRAFAELCCLSRSLRALPRSPTSPPPSAIHSSGAAGISLSGAPITSSARSSSEARTNR